MMIEASKAHSSILACRGWSMDADELWSGLAYDIGYRAAPTSDSFS